MLLAAKVLVTSRLLHTKLTQRSKPPLYLESLRKRLAVLRRRLLTKIDKCMGKPELPKEALVEAMCAFALATSSSPTDVLRHYHHVRLEAVVESGQHTSDHSNILHALKIYVNTLKSTRAAFPTSLAQALEGLKSTPILQSSDLYALIDLNIDLHEQNLGNDIRTFTPYIRLDDLQKSESERLLKTWGRQALSSILDTLHATLREIHDTDQIRQLRNETLELWFVNQQHTAGIEPSEAVDGFRNVFNSRWREIIHQKAASLDISSDIGSILHNWHTGLLDYNSSLWAPEMLTLDLSNGAKRFRETLTSTMLGHDEPFRAIAKTYSSWTQSIEVIEDTIQRISNTKWDDDLTNIDDDDDILSNKQVLLSEDDPRMLQDELSQSLQAGFSRFQKAMQKAAESLHNHETMQKAVFLLRIWREVRQHLPRSYSNTALGLDSIRLLQRQVTQAISRAPLERGKKRAIRANQSGRVAGRALWDGDPPVPVLPSPWIFRLMQELSSAMADIGTDVWSPQAIVILKEHLRLSLASLLKDSLRNEPNSNGHVDERRDSEGGKGEKHEDEDATEEPRHDDEDIKSRSKGVLRSPHANGILVNGEATTASEGSLTNELQIQRLYDLTYLIKSTYVKGLDIEDDLVALQTSIEEDIGLPSETSKRLKRGAEEHWKRTSLLFALLA